MDIRVSLLSSVNLAAKNIGLHVFVWLPFNTLKSIYELNFVVYDLKMKM